jgi:hypothetical protein
MPTSPAISESHSPPSGMAIDARSADAADNGTASARTMLDLFASVGATRFNVSWIKNYHEPRRPRTLRKTLAALGGPMPIADNENWLDASHIDAIAHADLSRTISALLETSTTERLSLIVRPTGPNVMFIQLDGLTEEKLAHLPPAMFLGIKTSFSSFQGWIALSSPHDKELARRGRQAAHSDISASGATRIAGSFNFKPDYAPNYPRVSINEAHPGRISTVDELERVGLLAPPEEFAPLPPPRPYSVSGRQWPSYAKSLQKAPLNQAGTGPDRSRADFWWCFLANQWGFAIEETAEQLLQESAKAQYMERRCKGYALITARRAAAAVERRRGQPRRLP